MMSEQATLRYEQIGAVAVITLDRPEVHNAFNLQMQRELRATWRALRADDGVRCVVLTGAGDQAFCSGIDRKESMDHWLADPAATGTTEGIGQVGASAFHYDSPGDNVGPKSCQLWKPVIAAVNGMAVGGAFFMLGEVEFVVAAEHATFFVPHLSFGMASTFEAVQLMHKMPFHELARMCLVGAAERLSARRAYEIGLVSEVVPAEQLRERAIAVATDIAATPAGPLEATVRALWMARDVARPQAMSLAPVVMAAGNTTDALLAGQRRFSAGTRSTPRIR
jgi:enoyl-CoA hydratase/carnithine racemase